ncbi:MAG: hypothetical protein AVDCRST_MAG08-2983 [uncultured Acetobacteraceae bacterium]|uniref:Uncharacterized protein n=1 Tax=uncultured Acetobacteraceae bacterium TaxID=169975 RepID=A0A6J4J308_9PROT|nr:MAG: hypothetical protein AVDCRST_MAG08-2983 [uncultured Acetobacteraceae bacterium]
MPGRPRRGQAAPGRRRVHSSDGCFPFHGPAATQHETG